MADTLRWITCSSKPVLGLQRRHSHPVLKKFVIFSDSLSSLQAIAGFNIDNDLVQKFIKE